MASCANSEAFFFSGFMLGDSLTTRFGFRTTDFLLAEDVFERLILGDSWVSVGDVFRDEIDG